jgi:outer membrane cobalamin receptor
VIATIREPGYLAARAHDFYPRRVSTPKGGPVPRFSPRRFLFTSLFVFLLISARGDAAVVIGRVVDPSARPVPGASALIVCGSLVSAVAVTDWDGRFRTPEVAGRCELRVALQGFAAAPVPLDLDGGSGIRDAGVIHLQVSAVSESVVVSAANVDVPLSQASAAVTVITGDELRARQITTLADALRGVPGLSVVRNGSAGAVTSVFPRGGESDYSLVLIDGIEANAFGGGFDFSHLPVENIDRIEVVRGPQSALFGSNAIGSVVRIITRDSGPIRADAAIEGGTFGTSRLSAASSGTSGSWFWGGGTERLHSNGWNGRSSPGGALVENDEYTRSEAGATGGWRDERGRTLRGEVRFERDDRGFPGPFGSNPIGAFEGIDRVSRGVDDRWLGSVSAAMPFGRRVRTQAQATWNTIDGTFVSAFGPSVSGSRRAGVRAQTDVRAREGLDVSAGVELERERATSTFITGDDLSPVPVERSVAAYFAEARWSARDRLFVTGGLRVDDIRREPLAGFNDPFSPRPAFPRDREVSTNPRIAAAWLARSGNSASTKLRAAAGTGIRPPDGFEIAFTDNPSLKPERSRSIEAGVDQMFLSGHALLQATVFDNRFDDLIVAVGRFRESSRYRTDNISNALARGVEISSVLRGRAAGFDLQSQIAYTFMHTEILAVDGSRGAPPPFTPGDPLLRRPRHQWSADLSGVRGRTTVWLRGGGRGRVLDVEPTLGTFGGLFTASGYAAWSAGGAWKVTRAVEVFARVENLFDRRYEEAFGFPALGRGAFAGVRVAARR